MKYLYYFLILLPIGFLAACKSENVKDLLPNDPTSLNPLCEEVLEGWEITSTTFPKSYPYKIAFLNEQVGFISGNMGAILKTTDGGLSWTFEEGYSLPDGAINENALTNSQLYALYFVDEQVGFMGGKGEYYDDTNSTNPFDLLYTDAVLLKTTDGGDSWGKQYIPGIESIGDLYFKDENTGIGVFSYHDAGSNYVTRMFNTTDSGASWNEMNLDIASESISGFIKAPSFLAVIIMDANRNRSLWKSFDQGLTWTKTSDLPDWLNDIQFIDDQHCFAKLFGDLAKSTNGGDTWTTLDIPDNNFSMFHFSDKNNGFAVKGINDEPDGPLDDTSELIAYAIYQTSDGGNTWVQNLLSPTCDYWGYKELVTNDGFYVFGNQVLHKFKKI